MAIRLTVAEVLYFLGRGEFDKIVGAAEDEQLEFKGSPYYLVSDSMKLELAKDVSALANADGGVIVLGFTTSKDPDNSIEFVDRCRPFDRKLFDLDQYSKLLEEWICPKMNSVTILPFSSSADPEKIVVALVVQAGSTEEKPFLVNRTVDPEGKVRGTQFGFYERVRDRIPATSAETLRGYIRDGMRYSEIVKRLDSIESFLGDSRAAEPSGVTEIEINNRISEAEKSVDRATRPNIILSAFSLSSSTFPELFRSNSSEVVKLIEEPPVMRREGFAITPSGGRWSSEIIQGRLRRLVARGNKLVELWRDGVLVTVGPADDDMLCWFTRNQTNYKPGLPIRSFVLAEVTLNFCTLTAEIFKHAVPAPSSLEFVLKLDNMTEDGVPCNLGIGDDRGPNSWRFPGSTRNAPASELVSNCTAPFEDFNVGRAVYELLGGIYVQFGFNYDQMPYIDADQKTITRETLFPNMQI